MQTQAISPTQTHGNVHFPPGTFHRSSDSSTWIEFTGQRARAELRAYSVASTYFDSIVPYTFSKYNDPYGTTAWQRYVAGTPAHYVRTLIARIRHSSALPDLAALVALDYTLEIGDRHEENWLLTDDNHVIAVDNEVYSAAHCDLFDCLRPIARTLLINDPVHTPIFLHYLESNLRLAYRHFDKTRMLNALDDIDNWDSRIVSRFTTNEYDRS